MLRTLSVRRAAVPACRVMGQHMGQSQGVKFNQCT